MAYNFHRKLTTLRFVTPYEKIRAEWRLHPNLFHSDPDHYLSGRNTLAERTHRQARSISYRIAGAKFPALKDIDKFVFADRPVDEGQGRELSPGAFLDAKRNAIFIGGAGAGRPISASLRPRRSFAPSPEVASSISSISSTSSNRRKPPAVRAACRRTCCATTSSSSTNSATCRSASPARGCCSLSSSQVLRKHLVADHPQSRLRRRAAGVRRRQYDHRHARPADAPLRHRRDGNTSWRFRNRSRENPRPPGASWK